MRLPLVIATAAVAAFAQNIELVPVVSKSADRTVKLPGEFAAYESVDLRAKVTGFVERVLVDRGSFVKQGQLLVELSAPEMKMQIAEADARVQTAESQRAEAQARLAAAQSVLERLREAAKTPGAVAGNEVVQAEKTVEAAQASVSAAENSIRSAKAAAESVRQMQEYLKVTAPFAGVVTERLVHPGALAGPAAGAGGALLRIEQNSRLRLIVAVPEADVSGIPRGAKVTFTVPAYPQATFSGTVARLAYSVEPKTRTMSVELDVPNPRNQLAPGMFPEVNWPVRRGHPALFVPSTAVVTTTERTFVIRSNNGRAEWIDVRKGAASGDLVEILGQISAGDRVVRRATDEIRPGAPLSR